MFSLSIPSAILGHPVAHLARPTFSLKPEDSLTLAIERLRNSGMAWVPVQSDHELLGWFGQSAALRIVGEGLDLTAPVSDHVTRNGPDVIPAQISGADALRWFDDRRVLEAAVQGLDGRIFGWISPVDLAERPVPRVRPPMVGGLATPFGVYLTTGRVSAGPPAWALATTGMVMVTMLLVASNFGDWVGREMLRLGMSMPWAVTLSGGISLLGFFLIMRLIPLSGTHGAEHQVVHTIERGEPLEIDVVRRMPRVHPRCGTNFATGVIIYLTLGTLPLIQDNELRLLIAGLTTLIFWRRLGSFVQLYFSTKPATDKQLLGAIRSANELLVNHQKGSELPATFGQRIWRSGLLQIMVGGWLAVGIYYGLATLFKWPIVL